MKKTYCDRCGAEMVQNDYLMLKKNFGEVDSTVEFFDICPKCRESFFGWLNNKPAEQEKPVKVAEANPAKYLTKMTDKPADKPAKKSANDKDKSNAYTAQYIAEVTGAPASTVRRHMEGICSTYGKDKQGRTVRYYHMTEAQLCRLCENIKGRKQGQRTKI